MASVFSDYIFVHDDQNVMDLPYYVDFFHPDCVVFEVAEYTFEDQYFSFERMQNLDFSTYDADTADSEDVQNE